jgi:hypothetical protein
MITGKANFGRGITTTSRINPDADAPAMSAIDGFTAEDGALKPMGGIADFGIAKVSSTGLTVSAVDEFVATFKIGTTLYVLTRDSSGNLRYCPAAGGAWTAIVGSSFDAGTAERIVKAGDYLLIPTSTGIKRIEPAYLGTSKNSWALGMAAPTTAPSLVLQGDSGPTELHDVEADWAVLAKPTGVVTDIATGYSPAYSGPQLNVSIEAGVAASTELCAAAVTEANLTQKTGIEFMVSVGEGSDIPDITFSLELYSDATCLTSIGSIALQTLTVGGGFRKHWVSLGSAGDISALGAVKGIGLKTSATWEVTHTCDIAFGPISAVATTFVTEWASAQLRDYCYSYAGRESRSDADSRWVYSIPSDITTTPLKVGPGQRVKVTCSTGTVRSTCDATYILIWRRVNSTGGEFEYAGQMSIGALGATGVFYDTGAPGDYDEAVSLNEILRTYHDVPPIAEYLLVSDQRVYAADTTGRISISNWDEPWYFPASIDTDAPPGVGTTLSKYAVTGTVFRGWGTWQTEKLVLLDNEMFVLQGEAWGDPWRFTNRRAVGLVSQRALADCEEFCIWPWGDDFFAWAAGQVQRIGKPEVDASKIDFTAPHDAKYWNRKYVLCCEYDGDPCLVIFDLQTRGWYRRSLACKFYGLAVDADSGALYGLSVDGYILQLFSGLQDWDPALGAYADVTFEATTQFWVVAAPFGDKRVQRAVFDIEAATAINLNVTVTTLSATPDTFGPAVLAVGPSKTRYDVKIGMATMGYAVKIKVTYTGQTPPTRINFMGFEHDQADKK